MRRMRGPVVAVALAACAEATPPQRVETYAFAIDCSLPDLCSSAADSTLRLIFRWSVTALPVRIWVQPASDLPLITRGAITAWERATLYGELRAIQVADSATADVIVRLGSPEIVNGGDGMAALDCRGQTEFQVGLDTTITLPFRTTVAPRLGASAFEVNECYHRVVLHELGHSFGLLLHSDVADDVMHERPTALLLSRRDIATFGALYHTAPTVRVPAGR